MTPLTTRAPLLAVVLASLAIPAWAQTDAERIRGRIRDGQKVVITDDQGRKVTGRIETVGLDSVRILADGQATDVDYGQILRIDRPPDTLANGALIGLGVGAGFGLISLVAEHAGCDPQAFLGCPDPRAYLVIPLITGGLGSAIGVGIDALIRRDREIYRRNAVRAAVAPVVRRGVTGAVISVSW
jgi:hypothetical protein